jgi:hypothetical protein
VGRPDRLQAVTFTAASTARRPAGRELPFAVLIKSAGCIVASLSDTRRTVDEHVDGDLTGLLEHQKQTESGVRMEAPREPPQLDARKVAANYEFGSPRYPKTTTLLSDLIPNCDLRRERRGRAQKAICPRFSVGDRYMKYSA